LIKTILRLVIAVALLNAVVRSATVAWKYYQLKDSAQQAVLFGWESPTEQIRNEIYDKAGELDVPLDLNGIDVRRTGDRTVAIASYVQQIELLPTYAYPVDLSFTVEGFKTSGFKK
jgi:hypothetical protein